MSLPHSKTEPNNCHAIRALLLSDKSNRTEDVLTGLMKRAIVAPNALTETGSPWCGGRSRHATPEERQPFSDMCRKMAIKFLWVLWNSERIRGKGNGWAPTQSCVDLTTTGASLTREEEHMSVEEVRQLWSTEDTLIRAKTSRRTVRHFKNCKQCDRRFLAKRTNQEFCAKKCGLRWNRKNSVPVKPPMMLETVLPV